jgi:prepilin-type processing-associated H-X9-DG protein
MFPEPSRRFWRRRGGRIAVLLAGALLLSVSQPRAEVPLPDDKPEQKAELPAALSLVPTDAFSLVHVRVAELSKREVVKILAQRLEGKQPPWLGVPIKEVDTVTFIERKVPRPFFGGPPIAEAGEAPPKEPLGNDKSDVKQSPEGSDKKDTSGLYYLPSDLIVVTTKKPYDQAQFLKAIVGKGVKQEHKGKTYYLAANQGKDRPAVYFLNDRTVLLADRPNEMQAALESPLLKEAKGPHAAALALAAKHDIVASVSLDEKLAQKLAKEIEEALKDPATFKGLGELRLILGRPFRPLLRARSAVLYLDVGKQLSGELRITCADAKAARPIEQSIKDGATLLRIFGIGSIIAEAERRLASEGIKEKDEVAQIVLVKLAEQCESALLGAKFETKDTSIVVTLPPVKFADLPAEAEKTAKALRKERADRLLKDLKQGQKNLQELGIGLHNFHDTYGQFPGPAILSKKNGKPLLSWRVAILPFIGENELYKEFKLDEPWNSPHNIKLLDKMPKVFTSPGAKTRKGHLTFYQALVGKNAAWQMIPDPKAMLGARGARIANFADGTSNTILLVESGDAVPWTQPAEITYELVLPLKLGWHKQGFNVLMADGSARFVNRHVVLEVTLRAAITPNGGEVLGPDWDDPKAYKP